MAFIEANKETFLKGESPTLKTKAFGWTLANWALNWTWELLKKIKTINSGEKYFENLSQKSVAKILLLFLFKLTAKF